jgi:hypothetical protein
MKQFIVSALALTSVAACAGAGHAGAGHADEPAAQLFRRCTSCHQPPDAEFATDRAWLDQIRRTA